MDDNENTNPISAREEFSNLLNEFLEKYPEYKGLLDHIESRPDLSARLEDRNKFALDELLPLLKELKNYEKYFLKIDNDLFQETKGHLNAIHVLFKRFTPLVFSSNDEEVLKKYPLDYPEIINQSTFAKRSARNLLEILKSINQDYKLNELNEKAEKNAKDAFERIAAIESATRLAAGATAGNGLAKYFYESHINFQNDNKKWIWIIIGFSLLILVVTLFFNTIFCWTQNLSCSNLSKMEFDLNNTKQLLVYSFTKITVIGTLIYGLIFSIKNYNSNRHNSILNKHRATALLSYPAILDVAGADKQDVILTQISECMFKHQDTGFGKPDDSGPSWEQIINLLTKTVGKSKEGG